MPPRTRQIGVVPKAQPRRIVATLFDPIGSLFCRTTVLIVAAALGFFSRAIAQTDQTPGKPEPGLVVAFTAWEGDKARATDIVALPNVWLYVPAGRAPTPFLPEGRFAADWRGFVSSEIRDNYTFEAELSGDLKVEVNGAVVLEATSQGTRTAPSRPVRLNKGTNAFKVYFASPAQGDAFVRLAWSSKEFPPESIESRALSHEPAPELQKADQLRLGRELFVEFRCAKCHAGPGGDAALPELAMDAPLLDGIGSRRTYDWMTRWVLDPKALRPTAHMPKLLVGANAKEDAKAITAFLASLKSDAAPKSAADPDGERVEAGKKLFEALHCAACHTAPETTEPEPDRIALKQVREKFAPGSLKTFLQKPEEHYAWIRMPNFKLSADEGLQLAAYLASVAEKPKEASPPVDSALVERGRKLVQATGCLNCHTARLENQFKAVSLAQLTADRWKHGCVADEAPANTNAPRFGFSAAEREALQVFGATDRGSLSRHVPAEFAERQTRLLNCRACHGKFDGFPALETLGGKLKPEWSKAFIGGERNYKPRPWLEARMPAFAKRAEGLAQGLAAQHGYPPHTPSEPPVDKEAAAVGRKLVSANGGFSCISCHGVGEVAAIQLFEAPGTNLTLSGERLLKEYFHRWLRNPLRVDPTSKMPVYFDSEGKSPLTDLYGGDGTKQIEAIWQYIRLGRKMPSPLEPQ